MATKVTIHKALLLNEVEKGVREALIETGIRLVAKIRDSMAPGTGKVYKWKGGVHIASAPGQPPAPFSRRLYNSITYHTTFGDKSDPILTGGFYEPGDDPKDDGVKKPQRAMGGYSVVVGSNVPYALALEMGRKDRGALARPYLWPMLKGSREEIKDAFTRF